MQTEQLTKCYVPLQKPSAKLQEAFFPNFIADIMNLFQNSMLDYNPFYTVAYRDQNFRVIKFKTIIGRTDFPISLKYKLKSKWHAKFCIFSDKPNYI